MLALRDLMRPVGAQSNLLAATAFDADHAAGRLVRR
jgi:hypothetical protein